MAKQSTELALIPTEQFAVPLEKLNLSDAQMKTLRASSDRSAAATAMLQKIAREIVNVKNKLSELPESQRLRELRERQRQFRLIEQEAAAQYNGAIELALSNIKGASTSDKIKKLKGVA